MALIITVMLHAKSDVRCRVSTARQYPACDPTSAYAEMMRPDLVYPRPRFPQPSLAPCPPQLRSRKLRTTSELRNKVERDRQ